MIILSLLNGSRLYGITHENSDTDILSIYIKHRKDYYINQPDKVTFRKIDSINYQITYVDFMTLCQQLLKCNPNYLIPLLSPIPLYEHPYYAPKIRKNTVKFIDYEKADKAFTGMAESAFNRDKPLNIEKSKFLKRYRDILLSTVPKTKKADIKGIKELIDEFMWK